MNFWFDLNSEELYKNSEKLNSDVCFFISKTANEVHSGIHIYSDDVRDNNLRNIFLGGEIISANITDDYYTLKKINETDTDNFLLLKHIINDQNNKEFVFYLLYTHLLPANHYKFLKLKGTDKYEFRDKVNRDTIDQYIVFEHSYPFYVTPEIKLLEGADIDIIGEDIVKGYVGTVKISNAKNILQYIVLNIREEGFDPSTVQCSLNDQTIRLSDIQCNKKPEQIKIKKDAPIYNQNHHQFAKLDEERTLKYIDYDSSKKRAKVEIQGEMITEIEEGYILAKDTEQNVVLCRKATGEIYATIAATEEEKATPSLEKLKAFLQNYYPLSEIPSEEETIKENVLEIDEDIISKLDASKQNKIKKILEAYAVNSSEKKYILINTQNITNITNRLKPTTNKNCSFFYYDKEAKTKIFEIEDAFVKIWEELNEIEKDIYKLNNEDIKFYTSYFVEKEGSGELLHYKVKLLEKPDKNNVCKACLYISDKVKAEVFVDEDDISEILLTATVTGSTAKKKGLLCYSNDIPDSILAENEVINLAKTGSFNNAYNSYKELLRNDSIEKIEIQKDGKSLTVNIDKNINLEFSVHIDKSNLISKVPTDAILGHMAKQSDRKYVDIALFTFEKAELKWFQWKIPCGTQLYKTVLIEDAVKKQVIPNGSMISLKPSSDFSGFSQIVSLTVRVCIYMDITSSDKAANKLLDATVNKFTCYLGYKEFNYDNGKTTCTNPEENAETTLACDLLSAFFSGKREIYDVKTAKDNNNVNYWIFSFTNSNYFDERKLFMKNAGDESVIISGNNYPQIYEGLSYKDTEYCNLENDLYLDTEPQKEERKYYFKYDNVDCFLKSKKFRKVNRLKMSDLFHPVKIDDKGKLYTFNYRIFDIFTNSEYNYKFSQLMEKLLSPDNDGLIQSIRNCVIQKPLEFDNEKRNDEFIKALERTGFTAIQDEQKDFWSQIKAQGGKLFKRDNCFWFYHPVTFLDALDSMGILNIHAKELRRVQERIVKMKCLQVGERGIYNLDPPFPEQTYCNHAVFLTIRAVDGNYLYFTGKIDDSKEFTGVDKPIDTAPSTYKYKVSSYWCVVLRNQAANPKTGIKELFTCEDILMKANRGYVVVVAWENTSEGRDGAPHYATVQPNQDSCDKIEEILLCNVGGDVGMDISIDQGFKKDKISELHFYYNENQDFRESYDFTGRISPSITELEERDGVLK